MTKLLYAVMFWGFILIKAMGTTFASWSWLWMFFSFIPWLWLFFTKVGLL